MPPLTATAGELLATVQELFPHEYQISYLTLLVRKQEHWINKLVEGTGGVREPE